MTDTLHDVVYREALHDYDPEPARPSRAELAEEAEMSPVPPKRGAVIDGYERLPADCEEDEDEEGLF